MATVIGPWLVSTVGEWLPEESSREIHANIRGIELEGMGDARRSDFLNKCDWMDVGCGRKYETMVFAVGETRCVDPDCECGLPVVTDWSEQDSDGYNQCGAATRGHYAMCEKWASLESAVMREP